MNCTIRTFIPYPTARTAIPRHEVVFPFPSPVMTSTSPRRGFSGNRSGGFRGSIGFPCGIIYRGRREASDPEGAPVRAPRCRGTLTVGRTEVAPVRASRRRGTLTVGRTEGAREKNRCQGCAEEGAFEGG